MEVFIYVDLSIALPIAFLMHMANQYFKKTQV
jgi:hypothetical protein